MQKQETITNKQIDLMIEINIDDLSPYERFQLERYGNILPKQQHFASDHDDIDKLSLNLEIEQNAN